MNRVTVSIHIIPSGVDQRFLTSFHPESDGNVLSSESEIKVNRCQNGYSIIYGSNVFKKLDLALLASNIVKIFKANLPDSFLDVAMFYHYETVDDDVFDMKTAEQIFALHNLFTQIVATRRVPGLQYVITQSMKQTAEDYRYEQDEDDQEYDDDNEEDDGEEFDPEEDDFLRQIFGPGFSSYDDDDDDYEPRRKKTIKYYGTSRVMKDCRNPKQCIRRHGVLVASSKKDMERDEKIIKDFLKDFIPGNARWKRDFRHDILKRWMKMYAVSKKQLKGLEKEHRRRYRAKHTKSHKNQDQAIDFTRKLLSVPIDRWNDPNR